MSSPAPWPTAASASCCGAGPTAARRSSSHEAFVSGMHAAFLVAATVALAGVLIALITTRGNAETPAHAGI